MIYVQNCKNRNSANRNDPDERYVIRARSARKKHHFPGSRAGEKFRSQDVFMKTGLTKRQKTTAIFYELNYPWECRQTDDNEQEGLNFEIRKGRLKAITEYWPVD